MFFSHAQFMSMLVQKNNKLTLTDKNVSIFVIYIMKIRYNEK